jgi:hypothetical protein
MRWPSDFNGLGRIKWERNANFFLDFLNVEMSSTSSWGETYSLLFFLFTLLLVVPFVTLK